MHDSEVTKSEFRMKSVTFEKDGFTVIRTRSTKLIHVLTIDMKGSNHSDRLQLTSEGSPSTGLFVDTVLDRAEILRDLLDQAINTEIKI